MIVNFDKHRREDGSINLSSAYADAAEFESINHPRDAEDFLMQIEGIQRINSRQASAVAIAMAIQIGRGIES